MYINYLEKVHEYMIQIYPTSIVVISGEGEVISDMTFRFCFDVILTNTVVMICSLVTDKNVGNCYTLSYEVFL